MDTANPAGNGAHADADKPRLRDFLARAKSYKRWSFWLFIGWMAVGIISWSFLRKYIGEVNVGLVIWEGDHIVLLIPSIVMFVLWRIGAKRGREAFLQEIRTRYFADGPLGKRSFFQLIGADMSQLSRYGFDAEKSQYEFDDFVQAFNLGRKYEKFDKFDLKDAQ